MKNESPTGWTVFVRAYKEKHPDTVIDYKELMKQYIRGVKIDGVLEA